MLLKGLSIQQGELFIEIAYKLIHQDGTVSNEEEMIFDLYLSELELYDYEPKDIPMETLLKELCSMEALVQRKVFFELMALALVDTNYTEEEEQFLGLIGDAMGIGFNARKRYKELVEEISRVYKDIDTLILEGK